MPAGYRDEDHLAAAVAWSYYQEGLTQDAIAVRLGMSRARVIRILHEARSRGLVRITVDYEFQDCLALETALRVRFGLDAARVVPTAADSATCVRLIGQAAGDYLDSVLTAGATLALGWGRTVDAALPALRPRRDRGHTVASLFGGLPRGGTLNPYDATARFARVLDAQRYYVPAPMFASSVAARDVIRNEPSVRVALERAVSADLALISASDLGDNSKNLVFGVLDAPLRDSLREAGAVGDSCGIYLDASGRRIEHPVTQRMIVPDFDGLLQIPRIVLASGGAEKVPVVYACLQAGLGHVLITDADTADALLERKV
ncbi:MAG: sugar-binding transcriptional regulator [Gammaproteobacteria bacterium]|nr:sugar-binding transcriptional regulator [Gammaproteobacteria bacterium]